MEVAGKRDETEVHNQVVEVVVEDQLLEALLIHQDRVVQAEAI